VAPTEWLKLFTQRDRLYYIFLRDWVDHIQYNTQGRPLEWSGIKGYIPFLLGFIYELRARKHLTKPLLDCTNAFLVTDPSLLNLFVKLTFTRTKVRRQQDCSMRLHVLWCRACARGNIL
jgi:hypothetical protein